MRRPKTGTDLVLPPWLESIHRDLEILPAIIHPKKTSQDLQTAVVVVVVGTYGVTQSR